MAPQNCAVLAEVDFCTLYSRNFSGCLISRARVFLQVLESSVFSCKELVARKAKPKTGIEVRSGNALETIGKSNTNIILLKVVFDFHIFLVQSPDFVLLFCYVSTKTVKRSENILKVSRRSLARSDRECKVAILEMIFISVSFLKYP